MNPLGDKVNPAKKSKLDMDQGRSKYFEAYYWPVRK
jgi:hypothetical protein